MRKLFIFLAMLLMFIPLNTSAATLAQSLSGRILLQIEQNGEAWYIDPADQMRFFLGRPADAFNIMRNKGLGIAHAELLGYLANGFPERLAGKILLDVQQNGEAYYVYPEDLMGYYLGRPHDALSIMSNLGLGIADHDLEKIPIDPASPDPITEHLNLTVVHTSEYFQGNLNAPIQLVVYTDFECPYCLRHHETVKQLQAEYGDDLVIAYRHFPLSFHEHAYKASMAIECAGEQGYFWPMVDEVFDANDQGTMSDGLWKYVAEDLGLNASQFNECLNTDKYAAKIEQDRQEGEQLGVQGTPTSFVNGEMISGAIPFDQFKKDIENIISN